MTGKSVNLKVINIQGQTMMSREEAPANGTIKTTIDMSAFQDGLYLVKAESGGKSATRKILKTSK
jgi:hypothetical protein